MVTPAARSKPEKGAMDHNVHCLLQPGTMMNRLPHRVENLLGACAAGLFVVSVIGFGAGLAGYAQARHPVALLGASGIPHALGFNLLGWLLPGLLAVVLALYLLARQPAGSSWLVRVAGQLLVLAGLAFAGMGLLPLNVDDLDGPASQAHASAWMVWALAFISGTVLLGIGSWRKQAACGRVALALGVVAAVSAFALQGLVPAPVAQRITFACWALWLALALPLSRAPHRLP